MEDTVSRGLPRRPRPPWFNPAVAVVGAGLVVYGIVGLLTGHGQNKPEPVVPSPSSISTTTPSPSAPALKGLTATLPPATVLLVGGQHPALIGSPTQWLKHLPVRANQAVTGAFAEGDGVVVQVEFLQHSDEGPNSRFYFVRRDGSLVFLVAADRAVASQTQRWVFALSATRPGRPGSLAEVALDGAVLKRTRTPNGLQIWADTAAGLLVTSDPQPGSEYADLHLIDPESMVSIRDIGQVGYVYSATSRYVAWRPTGCSAQCNILVADLTTRAAPLRFTEEPGYSVGNLAISPDGHNVAVSWLASAGGQGLIEVVNLSTQTRRILPGVATAVLQAADLAWTPNSRWLAIGIELPGDVRRVGFWPLTGGPVQLLPNRFVEAEDTASTLLAL